MHTAFSIAYQSKKFLCTEIEDKIMSSPLKIAGVKQPSSEKPWMLESSGNDVVVSSLRAQNRSKNLPPSI